MIVAADHRGAVRRGSQPAPGESGQLEGHRPAARTPKQSVDAPEIEVQARLSEQFCAFVRRQRQFLHADLEDESVGAHASESHGEFRARRQHQLRVLGKPSQNVRDDGLEHTGLDQVGVVEYDDASSAAALKADAGSTHGQSHRALEGRGVVAISSEVRPRERSLARGLPLAEHDRLAVARRGRQEDQGTRRFMLQGVDQPDPLNKLPRPDGAWPTLQPVGLNAWPLEGYDVHRPVVQCGRAGHLAKVLPGARAGQGGGPALRQDATTTSAGPPTPPTVFQGVRARLRHRGPDHCPRDHVARIVDAGVDPRVGHQRGQHPKGKARLG